MDVVDSKAQAVNVEVGESKWMSLLELRSGASELRPRLLAFCFRCCLDTLWGEVCSMVFGVYLETTEIAPWNWILNRDMVGVKTDFDITEH